MTQRLNLRPYYVLPPKEL